MKSIYFIAFIFSILFKYSTANPSTIQYHLDQGKEFLKSGQLNQALESFDKAILLDPNNYLNYFKRATTFLSLGKNTAAAQDLTKILELKPDFDKALFQRARIFLKNGEFSSAIEDLTKYVELNPTDDEAKTMLNMSRMTEFTLNQAELDLKNKRYDDCITHTTTVTRISPSLLLARTLRGKCHLAKGEIIEAVGDFARVAQLKPTDTDHLYLLSKINYFSLYETSNAIAYLKQCLHYDPEKKECRKLFKQIKGLENEMEKIERELELKNYESVQERLIGKAEEKGWLDRIEEKEGKVGLKGYRIGCRLFGEQGQEEAEIWCSKTLEIEAEDSMALTYRGQTWLNQKAYEKAVEDLEKADRVLEGQDEHVRDLLKEAHLQLKMSKKKDYYRLLGVSSLADSREIKKAYHKKLQEWHPEHYKGKLTKEEISNQIEDINQAYKVLSDPDMRQQYDNGFDPYDPEQNENDPMHRFPFQFRQGKGFGFDNDFPFGGEFKMHL